MQSTDTPSSKNAGTEAAKTGLRGIDASVDDRMASVDINKVERLSFFVDDIPYHVTHARSSADDRSDVSIQAVLGYLPFSYESVEKRKAILTILAATNTLPHVRFGMDYHNRIFAAGHFATGSLAWPDFIFLPLVNFQQEARPFMDLIGRYF